MTRCNGETGEGLSSQAMAWAGCLFVHRFLLDLVPPHQASGVRPLTLAGRQVIDFVEFLIQSVLALAPPPGSENPRMWRAAEGSALAAARPRTAHSALMLAALTTAA